jgi:hypothetical protein
MMIWAEQVGQVLRDGFPAGRGERGLVVATQRHRERPVSRGEVLLRDRVVIPAQRLMVSSIVSL